MNKVITVNLCGNGYQLEESGYDALRRYLEAAQASLAGNPDREEIVADIEHAIADRFRALLGPFKTVVSTKEIRDVLTAVGPIDDGSEAGEPRTGASAVPPPPPPFIPGAPSTQPQGHYRAASDAGSTNGDARNPQRGEQTHGGSASQPPPRRLYRFNEGALLAGVCQGLSVYSNIDVTLIRLLFVVISALTLGLGVVGYLVMAFSVPLAETPDEKFAAQGGAPTAQDFIRRAKEGYYEAVKDFPDKEQRRAWKKRFKRDVHSWAENLKTQVQGNSAQWQRNWQTRWSDQGRPHPTAWIAMPVLIAVNVALVVAGVLAIVSLLSTHTLFGIALPATLPIWLAVLIVIAACQVIDWPLKLARIQLWSGGDYGCHHHPGGFFNFGLVWLALFGAVAWYVYPQQTHEALNHIKPAVQQVADALQGWVNKK